MRKRIKRYLPKLYLCAMLAISALWLFSACKTTAPVDKSDLDKIGDTVTYKKGVSVNGADVGGMTYAQAKSAVEKTIADEIGKINLRIIDDDFSYSITAAKLSITNDMEDVLIAALNEPQKAKQGEALDFKVKLLVEREALMLHLDEMAEEYDTEPVEPYATAELSDKNTPQFTFHEGVNGRTLDKQTLADKIIDCIESGSLQAEIAAAKESSAPQRSMDFIKTNTQFRAKYTTRYKTGGSDQVVKNRCFNVQKGAELLSGCVVQPGEEFSFNGYVGLRTEAAGWKLANGISGGKEYTLQAGGGICQVSTTLYNALLCGNVKVTDRRAHSIPSDYVPKGLDATVDSSGIDLKFNNSTNAPLYVFAYITKSPESSRYLHITIELYGEPLPEGTTYSTRSEITEEIPRDEPVYTDDPTIPVGYQITKVIKHDGFVATAYVDEFSNKKLVKSVSLGTNRYKGNNAEISIGTGDPSLPVPQGAVPVPGYVPPGAEVTPEPEVALPTDTPEPTPEVPGT